VKPLKLGYGFRVYVNLPEGILYYPLLKIGFITVSMGIWGC
jgi:hypothetical protein